MGQRNLGELDNPEMQLLQLDVLAAIADREIGVGQLESLARRLTEQVNLEVRGDRGNDITIPNAFVKMFAPKFTNEKGQTDKTGELDELLNEDGDWATEGKHDPIDRLGEVADIVGKYALGISHVANFEGNGDKWKNFPEELCSALGYDYKTVLFCYVVKYTERVAYGKNKQKERAEVEGLLRKRDDLDTTSKVTQTERGPLLQKIWSKYGIDISLKGMNLDLSSWPVEPDGVSPYALQINTSKK